MATPGSASELRTTVLGILSENRYMAVATVRADGWPQTTLVGYANDDLRLYFAVARDSQKLDNIRREPKVSIALGQSAGERIRGLSMAALAREVADLKEIDTVNRLLRERYPEVSVFAPRSPAAAVIRATPLLISVIDLTTGPGEPILVRVGRDLSLEPAPAGAAASLPQSGPH